MPTPTGRRRADAVPAALSDPSGVPESKNESVAIRKIRSPRKYRNEPMVLEGLRFDSKREAARFAELRMAIAAGEIRDLEVHPRFPLIVREQDCGTYIGDFAYIDVKTGERVVEDVKSAATRKLPTYRLKCRLLWALYGLRVREIV